MNMPRTKRQQNVVPTFTAPTAVAVRTDHLKPKRKLTLDATSIVRLGEVVCQATGELEVIQMPPRGSQTEMQQAWAVPILDVVHNTEYLLIANAQIVGALRRSGEPIAGKYYAMRAGEIEKGKHFRHVDVIELELIA
jgi:hypothetical protein